MIKTGPASLIKAVGESSVEGPIATESNRVIAAGEPESGAEAEPEPELVVVGPVLDVDKGFFDDSDADIAALDD